MNKTNRLQMTDEQGTYTWTHPKTGEAFTVRRVAENRSHSYVARGNRGTVVYAERLADMRVRLPVTETTMSKTNGPEILRKTGENTYESQDGSIVVTRHERTSARTEETITLGRRRVRSADRWFSVCRRGESVLSAILVDTLPEAAAETAKILAAL